MRAMNWLVKEEPTHYGFDALVKDKKAVWSGVRNALAQKHLRAIKKGDRIFYYHTGELQPAVPRFLLMRRSCSCFVLFRDVVGAGWEQIVRAASDTLSSRLSFRTLRAVRPTRPSRRYHSFTCHAFDPRPFRIGDRHHRQPRDADQRKVLEGCVGLDFGESDRPRKPLDRCDIHRDVLSEIGRASCRERV